MSDGLTITSGGGIAVDSGMVRAVGDLVRAATRRMEDADHLLRRAQAALAGVPGLAGAGAELASAAAGTDRLHGDGTTVAHGCGVMADVFELVELRAQRQFLEATDPQAALALQPRIERLEAQPGVDDSVAYLQAQWEQHRYDGVGDQPMDRMLSLGGAVLATLFPMVGRPPAALPVTSTALRAEVDAARRLGHGALSPDARLSGPTPPVRVEVVAHGTRAPVSSVQESIRRIPSGRAGQVVVETYAMKGGARRFVVYVDGTRTAADDSDEPWDMRSNLDLWAGHQVSASQQAVYDALEAAGARPGDRVDGVGFSQGAANVSFLAMDDRYEVGTIITAGNPVEPSLAPDQTHVRLEHDGDLVANLAAGGSFAGSGSPGSITVTRDLDRLLFWDEHAFDGYVETAGMVDDSGDPRVTALRGSFYAELAEAESVEVTEYRATRG